MDITGRLTADAQVRTLSDNREVVNFSVAVNESYKPKDGERVTHTEFFDCSYWLWSGIAQYMTKGTVVEISGRVSARAWMDAEGQPKAGLNFHTSKIKLHGGSGNGAAQGATPKTQGTQAAPATEATQVHGAQVITGGQEEHDDLPF